MTKSPKTALEAQTDAPVNGTMMDTHAAMTAKLEAEAQAAEKRAAGADLATAQEEKRLADEPAAQAALEVQAQGIDERAPETDLAAAQEEKRLADEAAAQAHADSAAELRIKFDVATLSSLQASITELNVTGFRGQLVDELRDRYGLEIREDAEHGTVAVTLQGISTDPADSLHTALENWGNAARRAIAEVAG